MQLKHEFVIFSVFISLVLVASGCVNQTVDQPGINQPTTTQSGIKTISLSPERISLGYIDSKPEISYPYVVWKVEGADINLYNIETSELKQIGKTRDPKVSGNKVLYYNSDGIFIYDIEKESEYLLYSSDSYLQYEVIDGNNVFFIEDGKLYTIDTEGGDPTMLYEPEEGYITSVRASGDNVVFKNQDNQVMKFNINSKKVEFIDKNDLRQASVNIHGNRIVYAEVRGDVCVLRMGKSNNIVQDCPPNVNNVIVIMSLDGEIIKEIPSNGWREITINNRYVLWDESEQGNVVIYGYDMSTDETFRIDLEDGNKYFPHISGENNYFVYKDVRSGGKSNVFVGLAELTGG